MYSIMVSSTDPQVTGQQHHTTIVAVSESFVIILFYMAVSICMTEANR